MTTEHPAEKQPRLDLTKPEFGVRAENFLRLMNLPDFQDRFFADPGGVSVQALDLPGVATATISNSNRLIFQLLSDPEFNSWARDFQKRIQDQFPTISKMGNFEDIATFIKAKNTKDSLKKEFAECAMRHLAPSSYEEIMKEATLNTSSIRSEPDIAVVPLTFIAVLVVVVVALVASPNEAISRLTLKSTVSQLNERQLEIINAAIQRK